MSKLDKFSDDELRDELTRRALKKEENNVPLPLENIDWVPLTNYVVTSVNEVAKGNGRPKDFEHWLFETVMETVYGSDIWKWWNEHQ